MIERVFVVVHWNQTSKIEAEGTAKSKRGWRIHQYPYKYENLVRFNLPYDQGVDNALKTQVTCTIVKERYIDQEQVL